MADTGLRGITMEREQNSRGGRVVLWCVKIDSLCEGIDMKIIETSGI